MGNLLEQSKLKLEQWLESQQFEVERMSGKRWLLRQGGQDFRIVVRSHKDGSRADYTICNANWLPIQ